MPSIRSNLVPNTWTNITNGVTDGAIYFAGGKGPVRLCQAATAPSGSDIPVSGELTTGNKYGTFYSIPSGEDVWAYAKDGARVVVTDAG